MRVWLSGICMPCARHTFFVGIITAIVTFEVPWRKAETEFCGVALYITTSVYHIPQTIFLPTSILPRICPERASVLATNPALIFSCGNNV